MARSDVMPGALELRVPDMHLVVYDAEPRVALFRMFMAARAPGTARQITASIAWDICMHDMTRSAVPRSVPQVLHCHHHARVAFRRQIIPVSRLSPLVSLDGAGTLTLVLSFLPMMRLKSRSKNMIVVPQR